MNGSLVVAILTTGGVCSVIATLIGAVFAKNKMSAEAKKYLAEGQRMLTDSSLEASKVVLAQLRERNAELSEQNDRIEAKLATAQADNEALRAQVASMQRQIDALQGQLRGIQADTRATRHAVEHPETHVVQPDPSQGSN